MVERLVLVEALRLLLVDEDRLPEDDLLDERVVAREPDLVVVLVPLVDWL